MVNADQETESPSYQNGKTVRAIYDAIIGAYQNCKDKKQGAKDALAIYEQNLDFIEESRDALVDIDNLVDILRESLSVFSERKTKKTKIRKGSIISKLVPCGKQCNGCPHGPYLYRVYRKDGKTIWEYLGAKKSQTETEVRANELG